ncbi:ComEC/Rec2 family competence protein [Clostridium perfringens]|uniref:ComEC/Rec2 family competence protein n=1 Tax=Clostridium perfringens TaxID=1502 RepID=UPI003748A4DC
MIVGIAECTISINKNDIVDELYNEVYNPSGGIKNTLTTHDTDIELLKEGITLKADKTELDTVKNKKYKARYLRFTLNGANSTTQNRWVEVQAYVGELNILQNLTPSSNKTIYNKTYATDGNIDNSKYTYTDGEGESYLQYDLGQVREDIDFIHLWHYSDGGNAIYNGVKVGLSEDGIEFANVFDSKYTGLYRESERGNFIPVNQGAVVESMMSRIQKAEIKITPDAISNTVRDSMANDFTNSENLLSDGSKISSKKWTNVDNNNFLFDDNNNFAMLNIQNYNNGEITYAFDNPFKLQPDTYHCFHFKVFQEKMLADQRFKITLILNGENINLTEIFDGLVLSEIPNVPAKLFKYTFKTSNKLSQSIHSINIKVERKTTLNTPATLVIKEPQFEMGAFPTQWTYPYNLGLKEFESYREQTSKQISERVTSKDFESYKTQTAKEIAQIVKDTDGNFSSVNQKVDSITTNLKDVKNAQEPNLIKNSTGVNNLEWWKQISGNTFNVKTSDNDRLYYKKPYFINDGIVMTARFKVKPDTKYYLSLFLNSIQSTQVSVKIWYSSRNSADAFDMNYNASQSYLFPSNSNWIKNNKSIITPNDITIKEAYITISPNSGEYAIKFGELLFIEGGETEWRPAYDDSNENSSYFENVIKDVQQKITPDGIYTEIKKSSSYNSEVVDEISTLKQTNEELANDIEGYKNTTEKSLQEVKNAHTDLKDTMNGVFKDGVLTEAEKKDLEKQLHILEIEKNNALKEIDALMEIEELKDTNQSILLNTAKQDFIDKHYSLINAIREIIGLNQEEKPTIPNISIFKDIVIHFPHFSDKHRPAYPDISLIENHNGDVYLFDGGEKVSQYDVEKYLYSKNIFKVDKIFITHSHSDHISGIPYLIDKFGCKELYCKTPDWNSMPSIEINEWKTKELHEEMIAKAQSVGARIIELNDDIKIQLTDKSDIWVYNTQNTNYSNYNNISLGFLFRYYYNNQDAIRYFIQGDMSYSSEEFVGGQNVGKVDILKMGHHGNTSSNGEIWFGHLRPNYSIATIAYPPGNQVRLNTMRAKFVNSKVLIPNDNRDFMNITINKDTGVITTSAIEHQIKNEWYQRDNREWYYFKENGAFAKNENLIIGGRNYRFNAEGKCINPEGDNIE